MLGAIVIGLGTATFGGLGLLLGGTLKAEIVLALANILWFVMLGVASLVLMSDDLPSAVSLLARAVPSGALSEALTRALAGGIDWYGVAVLAVWGGVSGWLATRFFRFD